MSANRHIAISVLRVWATNRLQRGAQGAKYEQQERREPGYDRAMRELLAYLREVEEAKPEEGNRKVTADA